jgi:outer membrane protein with beta-barrel domain
MNSIRKGSTLYQRITGSLRTLACASLSLAFAASGFAQHLDFGFGFGVKGGAGFTDVLQATGTINGSNAVLNKSNDYIVGPVAELRIPFGFALEVDGLYRGTEYTLTSNGVPSKINVQAWEIPYLAKFRFPIPLLKPFISAGGAYRTFTDLPNNITPTHNAFVAAGGLELRISRLRLSAEARYLHWGSPPSNVAVRLAQSQGEVLFGLIF